MEQELQDTNTPHGNNNHPSPAYYPNLPQSWELFAFFLLFSLSLSFLISPLVSAMSESFEGWINLLSYTASFILLFFFIKKQLDVRQQIFTICYGKPPVNVLIYLLFITPLCTVVLEPLSVGIPIPRFMEDIFSNLVQPDMPAFLTVVIAAPLLEEILCRGIILEGLLKNRMNPTNAIICSSLIFAAMHLNLTQGISAFAIGCLMGWVYTKTRSLWTSIFIHFVNNGFAFLLLALTQNPLLTTEELVGERRYPTVYYLVLLVLCILLYSLYRYFRQQKTDLPENEQTNKKPIF